MMMMMLCKVAALAAVVAIAAAAPIEGEECPRILAEHCEADRKTPYLCKECVVKYAAEANCTEAQEAEFCRAPAPGPPAPPVPAECEKALEYDCGRERANHTLCIRCVDEHNSTISKAGCTIRAVEEFCTHSPVPPGTHTCPSLFMEACGVDRRNKTLCLKCMSAHADLFKEHKCSLSEEQRFCEEAPPPPAPHGSCYRTLIEDCEKYKTNPTECIQCGDRYRRVGNCSLTQIEEFCHVKPPPAPPTPKPNCFRTLYEDCEKDVSNKTLCIKCAVEHEREANCNRTQIEEFCHIIPPKPPSPPPNHPLCYKVLYDDCEKERNSTTACAECAERVEREANCTREQIDAFCHIHPPSPPGPPAPGRSCLRTLYDDCEKDAHNTSACLRCSIPHEHSANCTMTEIDEFCHVAPVDCPRIFEEVCGVDRHNKTLCDICIEHHEANITAHHCSLAAGLEFCKGAPTPTPSDKCHEVLVEECGKEDKGSLCTECEARHHNQTMAAKCTYSELTDFCKPVIKSWLSDMFETI